MFGCYSYMYMVIKWSRYMPVRCEALCWGILSVRHWLITLQYSVMYRSNRSFNIPPPGIPRAFYTFVVPGRREFHYQSLPRCGKFDPHAKGVGNLNRSLDFMWNLWALCTWRATMAGTQCASNVDCILTDWQVNEVNIVVKCSNRFPIPKLNF